MSMFQILTQEGWIEVLDGVLYHISENVIARALVAIYFMIYHQFVTLVSECGRN